MSFIGLIGSWIILQFLLGSALSQINPNNCVLRGDGYVCYIGIYQTPTTQTQAEASCKSMGMTLPAVTSPAENKVILNILNTYNYVDVWIGATESPQPWRWLDGTEVSYQGCYNKLNNKDLNVEKVFDASNPLEPQTCNDYCASLSYSYAGLQGGSKCWCGNQFGSEGQAGASCNIPCAVPETELANTCGGQAAQEILFVDGSYSNWFPGRPNNYQGISNCAVFSASSSANSWVDEDCRSSFGAICDIGASTSCGQPNTFTAGGRCLSILSTRMSYFNARSACMNMGGDLAQLKNSQQNTAVANYINTTITCQGQCTYWIGLTKWTWSWASGEQFAYTNWYSSYPTGTPSPDRCSVIKRLEGPAAWEDVDCNSSRYFICQQSNATLPTTTTTTTTLAPNVPAGKTITSKSGGVITGNSAGSTPATGMNTGSSSPSISDLQLGIIVGVGGGVVLIVIIIIIAVVCCRRYRNRRQPEPQKEDEPYQADYYFGTEPESETVVPTTPDAHVYQEIKINCESPPDVVPRNDSTSSYTHHDEVYDEGRNEHKLDNETGNTLDSVVVYHNTSQQL